MKDFQWQLNEPRKKPEGLYNPAGLRTQAGAGCREYAVPDEQVTPEAALEAR